MSQYNTYPVNKRRGHAVLQIFFLCFAVLFLINTVMPFNLMDGHAFIVELVQECEEGESEGELEKTGGESDDFINAFEKKRFIRYNMALLCLSYAGNWQIPSIDILTPPPQKASIKKA